METIKFEKGSQIDKVLSFSLKSDLELKEMFEKRVRRLWASLLEYTQDMIDPKPENVYKHQFMMMDDWINGVNFTLYLAGFDDHTVKTITEHLRKTNSEIYRGAIKQ